MGVRLLTATSSIVTLALALACGDPETAAPPEQELQAPAAPAAPAVPATPAARPQPKRNMSATTQLEGRIEEWDETDIIFIKTGDGATGVWCKDMDVCRESLSAHGHDPIFIFTVDVRPLTPAERRSLHESQGSPAFVAVAMSASPGAGGGDN